MAGGRSIAFWRATASPLRLCHGQVGSRLPRPDFGGRRLVVKQVCDADTRPQYGPKRAIKRHQLRRRSRAQLCIERFEQHRADPSCTEKLALQPQVVHLVIGVQNTHAAIELEAVNDQRWRGQADMLGPQIPMTFHDVASHDPRLDFPTDARKQRLYPVENINRIFCKAKSRAGQQFPADGMFLCQMLEIEVPIGTLWCAGAVETGQLLSNRDNALLDRKSTRLNSS